MKSDLDDYIFVNLNENKESFTGYRDTRVWSSVYADNCMAATIQSTGVNPTLDCTGETLLFQLISGLHASVNMHMNHEFYDSETKTSSKNYKGFKWTIGYHPDRIRNLYLVYATALRALNLISDRLLQHDF